MTWDEQTPPREDDRLDAERGRTWVLPCGTEYHYDEATKTFYMCPKPYLHEGECGPLETP